MTLLLHCLGVCIAVPAPDARLGEVFTPMRWCFLSCSGWGGVLL